METNTELNKEGIMKIIPVLVESRKLKYLDINLTKSLSCSTKKLQYSKKRDQRGHWKTEKMFPAPE